MNILKFINKLNMKFEIYNFETIINNKRRHTYHMVERSPYPFRLAFTLLFMFIGLVLYMNNLFLGGWLFIISFFMFLKIMTLWLMDVLNEGTLGFHTKKVQSMLKWGFALFIVSEIMFFFGFFWAFFHSSLSPTIWIGSTWPPKGIDVPLSTGIPLLNTFLLIFSGLTLTYAQVSLKLDKIKDVNLGFILTLIYACLFLAFQMFEYFSLSFNINDSVYGSCFFLLTGFHGFHVIIGTLFISITFVLFKLGFLNDKRHLTLTFAAWYWHFVDAVWIFLFIFVYVWGSWTFKLSIIEQKIILRTFMRFFGVFFQLN